MPIPRKRAEQLIATPYPWIVLGLFTLIYISSFVDRQIIAVLATQIRHELNLSNLQTGLLYGTAFSLVYAVSGIPLGYLADIKSRKFMIVAGLTVWSIMTFVSGFATSFLFLVTARLLVGISEAALSPAVYSLLSDYFKPAERATVFSIYASGIFIGIGVAFLGGGSIAQLYDWRIAMMVVGAPGIGLAVLAWFAVKELPRGLTRNADSNTFEFSSKTNFYVTVRYIIGKKTILYHFLGFSFLAFTGYVVLGFISTILVDIHDASHLIPHYGWFMFATALSVIGSGKIADLLADKFTPSYRFVMGIVAGLACIPLYYIGLFAESALTALILIGTANVISSSYNGVAAALLQYLVKPDMRALAGGLYLFVISVIGFGIGPPLTGWLMDTVFTGHYGPAKALFLVLVCCGLLGTVCILRAMKYYETDAEID